jgi:hypothetical protein
MACNTYGAEVHTEFWWKNHLEDPDVDGRIILKMYLREVGWD